MMRITYLIYVILFIVFSRPLLAANTQLPPKSSLSFDEYQYQRALYAFLTDDYITLSKLTTYLSEASSKEKNKALLIHSLSGINKIYPPADYPTFVPFCLQEAVVGLMFAPAFHPAMAFAAGSLSLSRT